MNVNEHERLSNITLRLKLKSRNNGFYCLKSGLIIGVALQERGNTIITIFSQMRNIFMTNLYCKLQKVYQVQSIISCFSKRTQTSFTRESVCHDTLVKSIKLVQTNI
jgi:hypothetical protein